MFRIQLDMSHEIDTEGFTRYGNKFACHTDVIEEVGPAGGNPVVEYSSNALYSVVNLLKDYLWDDLEDLHYYAQYITCDNNDNFDAREYF